jgi:hypothetical protein
VQVTEAAAAIKEAEASVAALRKTRGANEELIKKAEAGVITATAEKTKADSALETATERLAELEALREGLMAADQSGSPLERAVAYDINLELQPAQGDPDQVYVAELVHYPWRDDIITLKTTAEGLLTTADLTVIDRTSDILVSIASALAAFGIAPAPPPPTGAVPFAPPPPAPACARQPSLRLQWIFDPSEEEELEPINGSLKE